MVSVWGVTMMRDEADVAEGVLRHMITHVDGIVVADNNSRDGTREILEDLKVDLPIHLVDDPVVAYRQSEKMTALAQLAAARGAEIICPFDADELWSTFDGRPIRALLTEIDEMTPQLLSPVLRVPIFNHLRTALDVDDPDPFRSMVWRQRAPQDMAKVAFRWEDGAVIHQGNHGVTLPQQDPGGWSSSGSHDLLRLHHFPVRSVEQFISKARNGGEAYADPGAADLPTDAGNHWRAWAELLRVRGRQALHKAYYAHWCHDSRVDVGLIRDPAPYHG